MKENESLCAHNVLHKHLHAQSKATVTFSPAPKQTFVLLEQLDKIRIPSVCACVTSSMRVCLLISIPLGKISPAICSDSIFYNQSTLHKIGSDFCQGPSWFLAVNKNYDLPKKNSDKQWEKAPRCSRWSIFHLLSDLETSPLPRSPCRAVLDDWEPTNMLLLLHVSVVKRH